MGLNTEKQIEIADSDIVDLGVVTTFDTDAQNNIKSAFAEAIAMQKP